MVSTNDNAAAGGFACFGADSGPAGAFGSRLRHGWGTSALLRQERELSLLWHRFGATLGTRDAGMLLWPLDGWLHLDGEPQQPFPVILVQFSPDGVGVVLGMEHPVPPGQLGDLTTQAHGAGCRHRSVRCRGRETYAQSLSLQYAALGFDPQS